MSFLKINGLSKVYGSGKACTQALKEIDLEVVKGDFVAVMGASGSGKSTLLNLISTIDKPTHGEIWIDDTNIADLSHAKADSFRKNHLGFIFQDFRLMDSLTVSENISLPMIIQKKNKTEIKKRVEKIMEMLSIGGLSDKYPYQISGGEKQRTACARAIIAKPMLILADEPTGALDSGNARNIMEIMKTFNETLQTTILMVTHDPMSASYSKRVIFLKDGNITTVSERKNLTQSDFYKKIVACNVKMQQVNAAGGQK